MPNAQTAAPRVEDYIRTVPDFPKPGVQFRDVSTLFDDARGFRLAVDQLVHHYIGAGVTRVAGIEARGFALGGAIAHQLSLGFTMLRKAGKLPGETITQAYALEYAEAVMEVNSAAIGPGDRVLLVDDLLATGGTVLAAKSLIDRLGGTVVAAAFIVDLPDLGGRAKVEAAGLPVHALCAYAGD